MIETLHSTMRKARKDHIDNAGLWLNECLDWIRTSGELTFSELRAIAKLKANNWKILKGQMYQEDICKMGGEIYSFKCNPEINKICLKLDMYDDC